MRNQRQDASWADVGQTVIDADFFSTRASLIWSSRERSGTARARMRQTLHLISQFSEQYIFRESSQLFISLLLPVCFSRHKIFVMTTTNIRLLIDKNLRKFPLPQLNPLFQSVERHGSALRPCIFHSIFSWFNFTAVMYIAHPRFSPLHSNGAGSSARRQARRKEPAYVLRIC